MRNSVSRLGLAVIALFSVGWLVLSGYSSADMNIQKQAKAAGVQGRQLPLLPQREASEKGCRHAQRPRQVARRRKGEAQRQGGRRRLAEGLSRRQEVNRRVSVLAAAVFATLGTAVRRSRDGRYRLRTDGSARRSSGRRGSASRSRCSTFSC